MPQPPRTRLQRTAFLTGAAATWAAVDPTVAAQAYVGREYQVENRQSKIENAGEALAGARDIIAERVSDDQDARVRLRAVYRKDAVVSTKVMVGKETDPEAAKFKDYFKWSEPLAKAPSHRVLAMRRGEKELFLMMRVQLPDETAAFAEIQNLFVKASPNAKLETRNSKPEERNRCADEVRAAAPLGQRAVMAIGPGFRTGCKTVLLDRQGKLLHNDVIFARSRK